MFLAGRRFRTPWLISLARALVFVLVLPIASVGTLPVWAELAGVEGPHACHCAADKHDCICARCNPDRDDLWLTGESIKGQCGDDEHSFGGKTILAIAPAEISLVVPVVEMDAELVLSSPSTRPRSPPPTPPPRS